MVSNRLKNISQHGNLPQVASFAICGLSSSWSHTCSDVSFPALRLGFRTRPIKFLTENLACLENVSTQYPQYKNSTTRRATCHISHYNHYDLNVSPISLARPCLSFMPWQVVEFVEVSQAKWNCKDCYCWWLKSCTTWDVWNPINNGKNYLSTGAGFQPSTVCLQLLDTRWCV